MGLELRHLRVFAALGKELHFGRAADALHLAQPALSKIVQQLEAEIGTPLLLRTTRRVELTEAGKAFLDETSTIEAQIEQAVASARNAARGIRGELRIAYTDFAINGRLPHFLRDFAAAHPQIRLNLIFMPTTSQHMALLQQTIDVGFMIGEFRHKTTSCITFDEDEYVALLPASHPLCRETSLTLEQLADENFVLGTGENWAAFRTRLFAECRSRGFFPNIVLEASNSEGIFGLVVAGVGVTIYSSCVGNLPRQGVEVRPLRNVSSKLPVTAVWGRNHKSQVLDRFINLLRRSALNETKQNTANG
ncbi:LysR substrate-binding domain-containing protein [Paracoccus sp. MBLB3053]|uniref:LysR substrate-binding domain-containing protein n=1 Tax=Paracoccus aurantius TaxID=3073814 RepID=A0ABU2HXF2_9RHOB|nr:LysR substrate-binding domain-containing protein [Paracoccus sp. MBLB3053]MDS9469739.1 LysR substrate-binding domain-containing protein [Paracoccus sp. MBLB3053]